MSAGTSPDAETPISADLIEWADLILAMESVHRRRIQARFAKLMKTKTVIVLQIADNYDYMETELVNLLKQRVGVHLQTNPSPMQ